MYIYTHIFTQVLIYIYIDTSIHLKIDRYTYSHICGTTCQISKIVICGFTTYSIQKILWSAFFQLTQSLVKHIPLMGQSELGPKSWHSPMSPTSKGQAAMTTTRSSSKSHALIWKGNMATPKLEGRCLHCCMIFLLVCLMQLAPSTVKFYFKNPEKTPFFRGLGGAKFLHI